MYSSADNVCRWESFEREYSYCCWNDSTGKYKCDDLNCVWSALDGWLCRVDGKLWNGVDDVFDVGKEIELAVNVWLLLMFIIKNKCNKQIYNRKR